MMRTRRKPRSKVSSRRRRKSSRLDWDGSRYPDNWEEICAIAHRATGHKCCLCWVARSVQCHHVRYRDKRGNIRDRLVVGRDIFPLCGTATTPGTCHFAAHQKENWIKDKKDPVLGNHNTSEFVKKLKLGYQLLSSAIR